MLIIIIIITFNLDHGTYIHMIRIYMSV